MNTAPVKWAQRKDSLYVTITLSDVKDHKIDLTNQKIVFSGTSNGKKYSLDLELVSSVINGSESQKIVSPFLNALKNVNYCL